MHRSEQMNHVLESETKGHFQWKWLNQWLQPDHRNAFCIEKWRCVTGLVWTKATQNGQNLLSLPFLYIQQQYTTAWECYHVSKRDDNSYYCQKRVAGIDRTIASLESSMIYDISWTCYVASERGWIHFKTKWMPSHGLPDGNLLPSTCLTS